MPFTAANVLRSLGLRHIEQLDELNRIADVIEQHERGITLTTDSLRTLNAAWARGAHWAKRFESDVHPLVLP